MLFLADFDKIKSLEDINEFITAEIPDKLVNPKLYELVKRYMTHGPCGHFNENAPCMIDKECKKHFPKAFYEVTTMDDEGFPTYQRRDDGRTIEVGDILLDNRYIVPYNAKLLVKFDAHINVEKCNQSKAIKYLFKYISKGNDWVVAGIFDKSSQNNPSGVVDEIQQYYNFRYISACEASWRIFSFDIHHRIPAVERLSFHLPNHQMIVYVTTTII